MGSPQEGGPGGDFLETLLPVRQNSIFFCAWAGFFSPKIFHSKKIVGSLGFQIQKKFLRSVQISVTKSAVSDQTAQWATTPARDKSEIGQTGPQPQNHGSSQNLVARNADRHTHKDTSEWDIIYFGSLTVSGPVGRCEVVYF